MVAAESVDSENRPALKATGVSIPLLAFNCKSSTHEAGVTDPATLGHDGERGVAGGSAAGKGDAKQPLLLAEALERFHSQAAGFALDIGAFGEDQACWIGVMGALGYPRNKRAFRALATQYATDCIQSSIANGWNWLKTARQNYRTAPGTDG